VNNIYSLCKINNIKCSWCCVFYK